MVDALQLLETAVFSEPNHRVLYRWEDLRRALEAVISAPFHWRAERILLAVMRFDGALPLDESSELPHSMTPEDMLKSIAVQALARWTGLTHLLEMQRVEATAVSPALASVVRAVIREKGRPNVSAEHVLPVHVQTQMLPESKSRLPSAAPPAPADRPEEA